MSRTQLVVFGLVALGAIVAVALVLHSKGPTVTNAVTPPPAQQEGGTHLTLGGPVGTALGGAASAVGGVGRFYGGVYSVVGGTLGGIGSALGSIF
jgi:hypothetical protein